MKYLFTLLFLLIFLTGCKVNRYFFIAEEKISLFEFASFSGMPADTAQVGDTIYSTGTKEMVIGGTTPVEYKGYKFYSPQPKARFVRQIKVDPKKDASVTGVAYTPRKQWKELAEKYKQDSLYWVDQDKIEWYGQVSSETEILVSDYAIAKPIYKIPANSIVKIKRHSYTYWLVEINDMKGYVAAERISYFSKSNQPFVHTAYTGRSYDPDGEGAYRTTTPTTGATIHTGPRGGRYYINSHGNKTYVPRSGGYHIGGRGRR